MKRSLTSNKEHRIWLLEQIEFWRSAGCVEDYDLLSGIILEQYFEELADLEQYHSAYCVPDGAEARLINVDRAWDGAGELAARFAEVEVEFTLADGRQAHRMVTFIEAPGGLMRGLDDALEYLNSFVDEAPGWFYGSKFQDRETLNFIDTGEDANGVEIVRNTRGQEMAKADFMDAASFTGLWFGAHEGGFPFKIPGYDELLTLNEFASAVFALGRHCGRGQFEARHRQEILGHRKSVKDRLHGADVANKQKAITARQNRREAVARAKEAVEGGIELRRARLSLSQLADEVYAVWKGERAPSTSTIRKYLQDAIASGDLTLPGAEAAPK